MNITIENIIQVSVAILNEKGIEGLTTREMAKKLDIKSASLYWHIANKQDLYGHIAEYMCAKIKVPEKIKEPKKYLLELNKQYRAELLKIRDSAEILRQSIPNTPKRAAFIEKTLSCLAEMGVKEKYCLTAANMLNNYVLSFAADEQFFKMLPAESLRQTALMFDKKFVKEVNYDEQFQFGLKALFAGFLAVK